MRRANALATFLVTLLLAVAVAACGPPTMESQVARYKTTIDKLDSLATKQPTLKQGIDAKKAEFAAEMAAASAKTGEEAVTAMVALNRRMDSYYTSLAPPPAPTNTQPGSKLNGTGTPGQPAAGAAAVPAPGGKLGGAAPASGAPGGKLGGAAPAPGGKLGGAAPAPGGQPAQPAPDNGFGGK